MVTSPRNAHGACTLGPQFERRPTVQAPWAFGGVCPDPLRLGRKTNHPLGAFSGAIDVHRSADVAYHGTYMTTDSNVIDSVSSISTADETDGQVHADAHARFVLQKVQPALLGLMDGSVSTLAPLFAAAGVTAATGKPMYAFLIGLAASVGAGVSMGLAEALSDDGSVTGRGAPVGRGVITGVATTIGGMLHTFPFLIPNLSVALHTAYVVVVVELLVIAWIRYKFMKTPLAKTIVQVIIGGMIVFAIGIALGRLGASE